VRWWVPRLLGEPAEGLCAAAPHPSRERLQHRGVRQVAPHAGRATRSGGPVRPLAERLGVRLLLRFPCWRLGAMGPVLDREPEGDRYPGGVLRRRRPVLLPGCDGGPDAPVAA